MGCSRGCRTWTHVGAFLPCRGLRKRRSSSPQEILEVGKSFTRKHVGYKVRANLTRFGPALMLEGAMGGKGDRR